MSDYKIETKCIQSGYEPGNGEARVLPIYQSTTFRYTSSEQMGRLFDLENRDISIPVSRIRQMMRLQPRSAIWKAERRQCSHPQDRRQIFMQS